MTARLAALALVAALAAAPIRAQPIAVGNDDTVEKVLVAQMGKRVTLKLGPGDEITGVVRLVTPKVVHLGEVAGRELFDAIVDTSRVVAVLVRTR
jgi:hypothetical protein